MPKNSSKSKKDWVSGDDVMTPVVPLRAWAGLAVLLVLATAAFLLWKPKPLAIEDLAPSGAMVFVRVDDVQEHLTAIRASRFWQEFSKVDVPKLLQHSQMDEKTVEGYNTMRSRMVGTIDHPLFKQFFGREVAIAVYPLGNADAMEWSGYASDVLMITRTQADAQMTELLGVIWSFGSKDWTTEQIRYKKNVITAIHFKKPNITVYYTRVRDLLVISMNQNLVASTIDVTKREHPSMMKDEDFSAFLKDTLRSPDGTFYVHIRKTKEFLTNPLEKFFAAAETAPRTSEAGAALKDAVNRLEGIKFAGASVLAGSPIRSKLEVFLDPSKMKPEVAAMYSCAPTENPTLAFVPKATIMYQWINCVDFKTYFNRFKEEGRPEGEAENPFAGLEKSWGMTVEGDLLPVLGSEVGWFLEGIDVNGIFPVPNIAFFVKVKDEKAAGNIVKRIATTPVTLLQQEEYEGTQINFVSIPLVASFKPSYMFINGYLLIATSDTILKTAVDALKDPAQSLHEQSDYKDLSDDAPPEGNIASYMHVGAMARQSRSLIDWTNKWFLLKIKQAAADENALRQKLQALKVKVEHKGEERIKVMQKLETLTQEARDLQTAFDAGSVANGAKDTLDKMGAVLPQGENNAAASLEAINFKKSQASAIEMELAGIEREVEDLQSQVPDLEDDIEDFEQQKKDAENFHYSVEEVLVPLLAGLESFGGKLAHTTFKESAIESQMFLKVE
jgi:hypothetical protein